MGTHISITVMGITFHFFIVVKDDAGLTRDKILEIVATKVENAFDYTGGGQLKKQPTYDISKAPSYGLVMIANTVSQHYHLPATDETSVRETIRSIATQMGAITMNGSPDYENA